MKYNQKTYFDFAKWVTFNSFSFIIAKDCWVNANQKGKTYTDKEVFKIFIDDITNTH